MVEMCLIVNSALSLCTDYYKEAEDTDRQGGPVQGGPVQGGPVQGGPAQRLTEIQTTG